MSNKINPTTLNRYFEWLEKIIDHLYANGIYTAKHFYYFIKSHFFTPQSSQLIK